MGPLRVAAAVAVTVLTLSIGVPREARPEPGMDLRVLVVTDGGPGATAIAAHLRADGVPYRLVDLRDPARPVLDAGFLADDDGPNYQAVVLPAADPFGGSGELAALQRYEQRFGVRQVTAYVWPKPAVGLGRATYAGPLDGLTATVTPQGRAGPFGYLRGPVPFEDNTPGVPEAYGFLAAPAAGAEFVPYVTGRARTGATGVLAGVHRDGGREDLVLSFSYNAAQVQFRLLAPGIVGWATRGVHLGLHRNYFSVHVDDVFMDDGRWDAEADCTASETCESRTSARPIRMVPADVDYAVRWQARQNFTLDLVYNGLGSVEASRVAPNGRDPLTESLLAAKDAFRWTNHTYSHLYLGCEQEPADPGWRCRPGPGGGVTWVSRDAIKEQITRNVAWGAAHGLPLEPDELVTGEHSGLRILPQQPAHNPNLAGAVDDTGIRWLAADNSRMPQQEAVGGAETVPRYPINVFYNAGTAAEQVDEYNWIYTSRDDGGSGVCDDNPGTVTCIEPLDPATGFRSTIVPVETRLALNRILGNDPRPHFVHQGNLTEDRLLYPVLDGILNRYRTLLADTAPIVCRRQAANGAELRRQSRWARAVATGLVTARLTGGRVVVDAPVGLAVPLTVPEGSRINGESFGTPYAGSRSGWMGDTSVAVALP
jgi:hypothetical protein